MNKTKVSISNKDNPVDTRITLRELEKIPVTGIYFMIKGILYTTVMDITTIREVPAPSTIRRLLLNMDTNVLQSIESFNKDTLIDIVTEINIEYTIK